MSNSLGILRSARSSIVIAIWSATACLLVFDVILTVTGVQRSSDEFVTKLIYRIDSWPLDWLMIALTYLGTDPALLVVALAVSVWLIAIGQSRKAVLLFAAGLCARIVGVALKYAFRADRPHLKDAPWPLHDLYGFGYPSGHALMATVVLGLVAVLVAQSRPTGTGRWFWPIGCSFLILGIGISRVYLGFHWFNDVIGGYLIGIQIVLFALGVGRIWEGHQSREESSVE